MTLAMMLLKLAGFSMKSWWPALSTMYSLAGALSRGISSCGVEQKTGTGRTRFDESQHEVSAFA